MPHHITLHQTLNECISVYFQLIQRKWEENSTFQKLKKKLGDKQRLKMKNRKPLKNHDKWSFHFNKKTYRLHRSNIRVDEKTVSSKNDSKSQTSDRKIDALRSSFLSAFFCTLQHGLDGHDLLTTCCQHSISSTVSTF